LLEDIETILHSVQRSMKSSSFPSHLHFRLYFIKIFLLVRLNDLFSCETMLHYYVLLRSLRTFASKIASSSLLPVDYRRCRKYT